MATLFEQIRSRECDQRLAANIARLKELDATGDKVDRIAVDLSDLDQLIALHVRCSSVIAAHLGRLIGVDGPADNTGPDL
jgi:hypothetical protein